MKTDNEVKQAFLIMGIISIVCFLAWVINIVTFVQTVVDNSFVLSEIGVFTVLQGISILVWPLSLITGPVSLFL